MASNLEIHEAFLLPMKRLFLRPPHATDVDESAALLEYADALKPYSKAVLIDAWKDVRDNHAGRTWPPVAVCLKACRGAKKSAQPMRSGTHAPIEGRMVDGVWQPWVGCECARCAAGKRQHQKEISEWVGWMQEHYPLPPIAAQILHMPTEERFALVQRILRDRHT